MAYESLINKAKDYLKLDNSAFEDYYRKAAQNLQDSYKQSLSLLEKQYVKDKNAAVSQSMLDKRNTDQYLAARGLSRSGESVQERINANIALSNTLNSLADTNASQMTELAKSKNADLLSLEEKRLEHKNSVDKWNAEQAIKRREAAEDREYETMKIASQREYEDAVRSAEHELEAQIRAENARTEAEKAARDQQYKLDYYRLQQADKERLLKEERAYDEQQKKADREYEEAQKAMEQAIKERLIAEERAYNDRVREQENQRKAIQEAAKYKQQQADKERLLAEERAYNDKVRAEENKRKAEEEAKELEAKIQYYKMQQADKERLIAEERAYNESKKDTSTDSKPQSGSLSSSERDYISGLADDILMTVTDDRAIIKTVYEKVAAYNMLRALKKNGNPDKYISAIESKLYAAGYSTPSDTEVREVALEERLKEIYDKAYDDTIKMMAGQNINAAGARKYALRNAKNSQLTYLYKHCSDVETFYKMAKKIGFMQEEAESFIKTQK